MNEFDLQELSSKYNGKDGTPAYIAHQGKVYDVSQSRLWKNGRHMNRHECGRDLSADIQAAPHGPEVFQRVREVGTVKKEIAGQAIPPSLERLFARFPFLRRHPHPMAVHFPIVFMTFTPIFHILYLLTGIQSFASTSFHVLGAGILIVSVAIITGFLTWWVNYGRPLRPVTIKIRFSILLVVVSVAAFIWRAANPEIYALRSWEGALYFLLLLSLVPVVTIIGWYGALLTFPLERKPKT